MTFLGLVNVSYNPSALTKIVIHRFFYDVIVFIPFFTCIVQGWVHDCTGLGAQLCRAGCTNACACDA